MSCYAQRYHLWLRKFPDKRLPGSVNIPAAPSSCCCFPVCCWSLLETGYWDSWAFGLGGQHPLITRSLSHKNWSQAVLHVRYNVFSLKANLHQLLQISHKFIIAPTQLWCHSIPPCSFALKWKRRITERMKRSRILGLRLLQTLWTLFFFFIFPEMSALVLPLLGKMKICLFYNLPHPSAILQ